MLGLLNGSFYFVSALHMRMVDGTLNDLAEVMHPGRYLINFLCHDDAMEKLHLRSVTEMTLWNTPVTFSLCLPRYGKGRVV